MTSFGIDGIRLYGLSTSLNMRPCGGERRPTS